jgi:import inner membrane translocase subunit TIM23
MSSSSTDFENDAGASRPIPSFDTSKLKLSTLSSASDIDAPDYLEYENSGRGLMQTMFANAGLSYLLGTVGGGVYGFQEGLKHTPSHRFRIKLNSVLNHCSRHGSRVGNMLGVWSVLYTFYENMADQVSFNQ